MRRIVTRCLVGALVAMSVCSAQRAFALQYTLQVIGSLGSGAETINDSGIVVGSQASKPYRWDTRAEGGVTGMTLSDSAGIASAVNEWGDVAGEVAQEGVAWREAFRWTSGAGLQRLGLLDVTGAIFSKAYGINDSGAVVGYCSNASNWNKAFIATGATIEEIVPPEGWHFTQAMDINNSGVVVGSGTVPYPLHGNAFVYDTTSGSTRVPSGSGLYAFSAKEVTDNGLVAGRADDLNHSYSYAYYDDGALHGTVYLGGLGTEARGTNNRGDLVGAGYASGSNNPVWFSFVQGEGYHNLSSLSGGSVWAVTALNDVNNHGQIVGVGQHLAGNSVAVLLTPSNFADSNGNVVTLNGGETSIGGLVAEFADITSPGSLNSAYTTPTADELIAQYGALPGGISGEGAVQEWELDFSGVLGDPATVTFCYDETLIPFAEEDLRVGHWVEGAGWQVLASTVDTTANTVTFATPGFSPFVVLPVPEPGCGAMMLVGGLILVVLRRQRRQA